MNYNEVIKSYDSQVKELTAKYEALSFSEVHAAIVKHLPDTGASILDVGSGSGRDAAWLAEHGFDVIAMEPSTEMLREARNRHPHERINWVQDSLPDMKRTIALGMSFDMIILSAVWMHVAEADRARVFRKLVTLLKAGGTIAITLRHGPHQFVGSVHPVSVGEIEKLAVQHGLAVALTSRTPDRLGRADVFWETVILHLPDDGTGALPLLRNIIINDSKSSTYKLALLRVLVRLADSASSLAVISDDEFVRVPLGLVALYWIRLYKPLIENGVPQMPANQDKRGLSFVKDPFHQLRAVSPFELRVGSEFQANTGDALLASMKDAAQTIRKMPAFYITYANSAEPVFKVTGKIKPIARENSLTVSAEFLWSFGEFHIPIALWRAFTRYAAWIEPSLLYEWSELMRTYAESHGTTYSLDALMEHLKWLDPERGTALVRSVVSNLYAAGSDVYCVWSGKRLKMDRFDVDHCFPFAAWPCNDLWNLLPADRDVNNRKRDKLVTVKLLTNARERMETFWNDAYLDSTSAAYAERFKREALASLPLAFDGDDSFFDCMFEALQLKRAGLKQNQNLSDWEY